MPTDLSKFKGTLPYASERFGIYQPLLGWRSQMTLDRMTRSQDTVFRTFTDRALARVDANVQVKVLENGTREVSNLVVPDVVNAHLVPRVAREIDSIAARVVSSGLAIDNVPNVMKWQKMLDRETVLTPQLAASRKAIEAYLSGFGGGDRPVAVTDIDKYIEQAVAAASDGQLPKELILKALLDREVGVSAYLYWLSRNKPDVLETLFFRSVESPFQDVLSYVDPLTTFGDNGLSAVLSPIGVVHLFAQHFFELDSFIGPAVGHIWLSPGSSLELVEESTKTTRVEKTVEASTETTTRSETEAKDQDELSTAIRDENRSDFKLGFGASVNYHNGTVDAGAHTDLSLDNSRTSARETAHKRTREQSQKLSNEIRSSFKSTFKTTTETTNVSGRRYVLQNKTDELINYELRRKMRHVGVQVQDMGTQLCWQVFIDEPGEELGVSKLVHIASSPDLTGLRAPEPPAQLPIKRTEHTLQFAYQSAPDSEGGQDLDTEFTDGDDHESHLGGSGGRYGNNNKIIPRQRYTLPEPPDTQGYRLGTNLSWKSSHPGTVDAEIVRIDEHTIELVLHHVNFAGQQNVAIDVSVDWLPDPAQNQALVDNYKKQLATYDAEVAARQREQLLQAIKERVNLASRVTKRDFEDLREEERIVVYRQLIKTLMSVGQEQKQDVHVTTELIRSIFDVDAMLYFVAPEWWRPRARYHASYAPDQPTVLTERDVVGWEGKASARDSNYLITEDSAPAPLGSSLGWLLQLDGDDLRNTFLNSPWVKAIIPIRPGKERAALRWLELAHVAGTDGLDAAYDAPNAKLSEIIEGLKRIGYRKPGDTSRVSVRDALVYLAYTIEVAQKAAGSVDPKTGEIPTETVFEHGFDPLRGGIKLDAQPVHVFSEYTEVLPTDQIVALEYDAAAHR